MFILILNYVKPLSEVDRVLAKHVEFLKEQYAIGAFICSGRRNPRTGGVILCRATNKEEVEAIIEKDPFSQEGIAEYQVVDFEPSMCAEGFKAFL